MFAVEEAGLSLGAMAVVAVAFMGIVAAIRAYLYPTKRATRRAG